MNSLLLNNGCELCWENGVSSQEEFLIIENYTIDNIITPIIEFIPTEFEINGNITLQEIRDKIDEVLDL